MDCVARVDGTGGVAWIRPVEKRSDAYDSDGRLDHKGGPNYGVLYAFALRANEPGAYGCSSHCSMFVFDVDPVPRQLSLVPFKIVWGKSCEPSIMTEMKRRFRKITVA